MSVIIKALILAACAFNSVNAQGSSLQCNYSGQIFPICRIANAWSYENGRVCVGISRCVSQSPPYGVFSGTSTPTTQVPTTTVMPTTTPRPTNTLPPVTTPAPPSMEWLPSWATTMQLTEPNNQPPSLNQKTLRQFVWPTYSGNEIRLQLSNARSSQPLMIQEVHIAYASTGGLEHSNGAIDPSTDKKLTFSGSTSTTVPAGGVIWSDPITFPLKLKQLTAISMAFGGNVPTQVTGHPGARQTSYIASGSVCSVADIKSLGGDTRDRWYFINAIEVMAPKEATAIAILGDSITDGYGVLNKFSRWPDALTTKIDIDSKLSKKRSVLNFGMGANELTRTSQYQDAGEKRFETDILTRPKISHVIVFEGINDIESGGVNAQVLINAHKRLVAKAHAAGLIIYGATLTPSGKAGVRSEVNAWMRGEGQTYYDGLIDFEKVLGVNPSDPNSIAPQYKNDNLHPNLDGYAALGNSVDLSLFY